MFAFLFLLTFLRGGWKCVLLDLDEELLPSQATLCPHLLVTSSFSAVDIKGQEKSHHNKNMAGSVMAFSAPKVVSWPSQ